jgi:hypothetical protein
VAEHFPRAEHRVIRIGETEEGAHALRVEVEQRPPRDEEDGGHDVLRVDVGHEGALVLALFQTTRVRAEQHAAADETEGKERPDAGEIGHFRQVHKERRDGDDEAGDDR